MDSQQVRNLQEAYLGVYDNLDEAYTPGPTQAEIRSKEKEQRAKQVADAANQSGYGDKPSTDWKLRVTPSTIDRKGRTVSQRMNMSHDYKNRLTGEMGRKYGSRQAAEVTRTIEGPGEPQSVTYPRKTKPSREIIRHTNLNNSYDLYDVILSHLLDEGYAETVENAEAIMVNMSEEWRESIFEEVLDEAYVDYRKGKLSTGKSPQQRMSSKLDSINATARRERGEVPVGGSVFTPATTRSQKMGAVKREMDAHTGVGGAINKALTPGLGNRAGASPRVAYGEPNTERHQRARYRRGEPSTRG